MGRTENLRTNYVWEPNETGVTLLLWDSMEEKIVLPDELEGLPVTELGRQPFPEPRQITELILPKSLKKIPAHGFEGCTRLRELILPETVAEIGDHAFYHCDSLKKITIPQGATLGKGILGWCNKIEDISPLSLAILKVLDKSQRLPVLAFTLKFWSAQNDPFPPELSAYIEKNKELKKNLLQCGDSQVISSLLDGKIKLTLYELAVYLDYSISHYETEITAMFLAYKSQNYSIEEQNDHEETNELVEFGLEHPTMEQLKGKWNIKRVNGHIELCGYKGAETQVLVPSQTKEGTKISTLGLSLALQDPTPYGNIKEVIFSEGIETIGLITFRNCKNLHRITFPESLKRIEKSAFSGCEKLTEIVLPQQVGKVETYAFQGCSNLISMTLSEKMQSVKEGTFAQCFSLPRIKFPRNIKKIGSKAFEECANLSHIYLPETVTIIEPNAFAWCIRLLSVKFPEKLKKIGKNAFKCCLLLEKLNLPENVEFQIAAFLGCESLTEVTIPTGVTIIPQELFAHCTNLQKVTLPEGLLEIGHLAFSGCENLTDVNLPSSLSLINDSAFFNCPFQP